MGRGKNSAKRGSCNSKVSLKKILNCVIFKSTSIIPEHRTELLTLNKQLEPEAVAEALLAHPTANFSEEERRDILKALKNIKEELGRAL